MWVWRVRWRIITDKRSCALSVFPSCSPGMNKFANMFQSQRLIKTDRLQYCCKSERVWALLDREDLGDMYKRQPRPDVAGQDIERRRDGSERLREFTSREYGSLQVELLSQLT